ncbi:MAG: TrmB family transcriptional regulator [Methanomicrobiales archaeon]|nr:TrmB family transcriptional regulator [Methanomicrobiales archaeon]
MTSVDQNRLVEILKNLGLTKYEALVYIGLLGIREGSATEIHEISGVPRASVYPALNRLMQKNLVSISHTSPRRYRATPPEEGIGHLLSRIEVNADEAKETLREIHQKPIQKVRGEEELIWSIYGKEHIIDRLVDLIEGAKVDIRLMAHWDLLQGEVADALIGIPPAVKVEMICDRWESERQPHFTVLAEPVQPFRDSIPPPNMAGMFLVDGKQVMVSMGSGDEMPSALFSESAGFVQFFLRYYRFILDWKKQSDQ